MAKAAKKAKEYTWQVYAIRKKGTYLGSVLAPDDEQAAVSKYVKEEGYSGDPRKLFAMREG